MSMLLSKRTRTPGSKRSRETTHKWRKQEVRSILEYMISDVKKGIKPMEPSVRTYLLKMMDTLNINIDEITHTKLKAKIENLKKSYYKMVHWKICTAGQGVLESEGDEAIRGYILKQCPEFEMLDEIYGIGNPEEQTRYTTPCKTRLGECELFPQENNLKQRDFSDEERRIGLIQRRDKSQNGEADTTETPEEIMGIEYKESQSDMENDSDDQDEHNLFHHHQPTPRIKKVSHLSHLRSRSSIKSSSCPEQERNPSCTSNCRTFPLPAVEQDEFTNFCSSLIPKLRRIYNHSPMKASELQYKVHELFYQYESSIFSSSNSQQS